MSQANNAVENNPGTPRIPEFTTRDLKAIRETARSGDLGDLARILRQKVSSKVVASKGAVRRTVRSASAQFLDEDAVVTLSWAIARIENLLVRAPLRPKQFRKQTMHGRVPMRGSSSYSRYLAVKKLVKPSGLSGLTPAEREQRLLQRLANALAVLEDQIQDVPSSPASRESLPSTEDVLEALTAKKPWKQSVTSVQRAREAQLRIFNGPEMLTVEKYVELSQRGRSSVYDDLRAVPPRLLALKIGAKKRIPDWQLDDSVLEMVRKVLNAAEDVDNWTVFFALTRELPGLNDLSPVAAVQSDPTARSVSCAASAACAAMDVH